jgi:hypothetical protein
MDKQKSKRSQVCATLKLLKIWSAGRELNPRIQVLQTCALATSPPALFEELAMSSKNCNCSLETENEKPTAPCGGWVVGERDSNF